MKILQIGCNDCNDHVRNYVNDNLSSVDILILVDPQSNNLEKCKEIYKDVQNLVLIDKAVTANPDQETMVLYTNPTDDPAGIHNSISKNHLIGHNHNLNNITSQTYSAIHINQILSLHNCQILDRLYVDTEGYDIEILKSIDFNRFIVKYIRFEFLHCEGAFSGMSQTVLDFINILKQHNYSVQHNSWDMEAFLNDRN